MNVDYAITKAFSHAQGKAVPPAIGSPKYNQLLILADSVQKDIADEPIDWNWLYDRQTISGSISDTFDLDDTVNYVIQNDQDPVLVGTTRYTLVRPQDLHKYRQSNVCAQIGQTLKFSHTLDGSDITVPVILRVNDITQGTDIVQVPSQMGFIYLLAAEYDRNDLVKLNQFSNILAKGNNAIDKLKQINESSRDEVQMDYTVDGMTWV